MLKKKVLLDVVCPFILFISVAEITRMSLMYLLGTYRVSDMAQKQPDLEVFFLFRAGSRNVWSPCKKPKLPPLNRG